MPNDFSQFFNPSAWGSWSQPGMSPGGGPFGNASRIFGPGGMGDKFRNIFGQRPMQLGGSTGAPGGVQVGGPMGTTGPMTPLGGGGMGGDAGPPGGGLQVGGGMGTTGPMTPLDESP